VQNEEHKQQEIEQTKKQEYQLEGTEISL